jgi:alpha-amylase/alpha-mannosidase (GH57 family)
MAAKRLHLAIVWHMHQPMYKDARTGIYMLPWVRLHGTKDYADMVEMLREFPDVRVTFNLVPSLIEQIEDYSHNQVRDVFLDASRKAPEALSDEERQFLFRHFFTAHKTHAIGRYSGYNKLYRKALALGQDRQGKKDLSKFTRQDIIDLQAFFNLVWIDPSYLRDPDIAEVASKTSGFTEEDRDAILDKQFSVLRRVTDAWRHALARGQIEISSSPYFHPILPLLCDASVAREALPTTPLPRVDIKWPEDAHAQLQEAATYHAEVFGAAPKGLWPSEGGVSQQALTIARKVGFEWAATDEDILARALGVSKPGKREVLPFLYKPYAFDTEFGQMALLFRDKVLSDLMGFTYMNWAADAAVNDFIARLERVLQASQEAEPLVTVVLDGENCWEFYPNDGRDFLELFYRRLSSHPKIETTTPSEYLARFPATEKLAKIPPGSWIDGNFRIWIGHPEDNAAWGLVAETRDALKKFVQNHPETDGTETVKAAWREIYVAEGSDWNWWYGEDHTSGYDVEFDSLFRNHLIRVYELLRLEVPSRLYAPVQGTGGTRRQTVSVPPGGFLEPKIDGRISDYYEWRLAGYYDITRGATSMRQVSGVIRAIYYGYDDKSLYLRVDTVAAPLSQEFRDLRLVFEIMSPVPTRVRIPLGPAEPPPTVSLERRTDSSWEEVPTSLTSSIQDVVEVAVPFLDIGLVPGNRVEAVLLVMREDMVVESWPAQEKLSFQIPRDESEISSWTA